MSPHYSRMEKMKNNLKRQAEKRDRKLGEMTEEDWAKPKVQKELSLDEKLRLHIWDFRHQQLPVIKHKAFSELIDEKLKDPNLKLLDKAELEEIRKKLVI